MSMPPPLPEGSDSYLTADHEGIGGTIKERPEDFLVEEEPLYQPTGNGEHLMLFVEKRNQTTTDVARRLAQMFGVRPRQVGFAGLKDKHAVTRQHFTIHQPDTDKRDKGISRFEFTPFKLLWAEPHQNKLRIGHLAGNRFVIRIRGVQPASVLSAHRSLLKLEAEGVPNFVGQQRFGARKVNHLIGHAILTGDFQEAVALLLGRPTPDDSSAMQEARGRFEQGDYRGALELWPHFLRHDRQVLDGLRQGRSAEQVIRQMDEQARHFMVCALQAAVFNRVLARRLKAGLFHRLVAGDIAGFDGKRAVFRVDEPTAELENGPEGRVQSLEVSPTGPMWGPEMMQAQGQVGRWELEGLAEFGVNLDMLNQSDLAATGTRRPLRIRMRNPDISGGADEHGPLVRLSFDLPRGSFATMVLREIMKTDLVAGEEEEHE